PLDAELIVQFVEQHPLEALATRATHDGEVEVLVLRILMIGRPGRQLRLTGVMRQKILQPSQLSRRHAFGGKARRHALERLADEKKLLEILRAEVDDAYADARRAHHQPALEPSERFAQWPPADPELPRELGLRQFLSWLELTGRYGLDQFAECLLGERGDCNWPQCRHRGTGPFAASEQADRWPTCQKRVGDRSMSVDSLQRDPDIPKSAAGSLWHPRSDGAREFAILAGCTRIASTRDVDNGIGRRHAVAAPCDMAVRTHKHETAFVKTRDLPVRHRHDGQRHRADRSRVLKCGHIARGCSLEAEQNESPAEQIERRSAVGYPSMRCA